MLSAFPLLAHVLLWSARELGIVMPLNLDQMFASHLHALQVGNRRVELLAANIANADTPGYLARDVDFRAAMREATDGMSGTVRLESTRNGHMNAAGGALFVCACTISNIGSALARRKHGGYRARECGRC